MNESKSSENKNNLNFVCQMNVLLWRRKTINGDNDRKVRSTKSKTYNEIYLLNNQSCSKHLPYYTILWWSTNVSKNWILFLLNWIKILYIAISRNFCITLCQSVSQKCRSADDQIRFGFIRFSNQDMIWQFCK